MSNSSKANIADGEKIKQFRLGKFWSQEELADRAAIALNTLQDVEAGKRRPKFQTIQKLACVFNVDPQELTSPHCLYTQANGNIEEALTLPETQSTIFAHSGNGKMESMPSSEEMANELTAYLARIASMMHRREFMQILAGAGLTASGAQADTLQSIQYGLEGRKVGSDIIDWARDQILNLNQLAVSISSKQLYPIAQFNINLLLTLLQRRAVGDRDEEELRLLLAHMSSLAGWFAEDVELLDQAAQHYHFSVEMARSAGNQDLSVYSLTRIVATLLAKGKPTRCLSQLEIAEIEAGQDSPWSSFIHMFAVEAYGRLNDPKAAQLTLAKADKLFEKRKNERLPEWAFWLPNPSLSAIAGRSFIPHDPHFAVRILEEALRQIPIEFTNDRLHLLIGSARARQGAGEVDGALPNADKVLQDLNTVPPCPVWKKAWQFFMKISLTPL